MKYSIFRNDTQLYKPMGLHDAYKKYLKLKDKFNKNAMDIRLVKGGFMVGRTKYAIRRV